MGQHAPHPSAVVRVLLADAIDYAGLFPPAQLDMAGAVAEYASYLGSADAWALGRFVVPATRLDELALVADESLSSESLAARDSSLGEPAAPWRLSALVGADVQADIDRLRVFNAMHAADHAGWRGRVDAIEVRASSPEAIAAALRLAPADFDRFVEIPIVGDARPLVREIASASAFAKVRTGGTTVDAFPTSDDLARFLAACVAERVPFKATAGLHHPLRGDYPLTYAAGSALGTMYGFLNVFLATAFLSAGQGEAVARQVLDEQELASIQFADSGLEWRGHGLTTNQLLASRDLAMRSFGSCSFREPLDDLAALGIL